jgi:hypothetical protein
MKKPLTGIPLIIFRGWLYAPLLLLAYLDVAAFVVNSPKVGWTPLLVGWAMSLLIFWIVLFSGEFREFLRATPFRILCFFGIAFGVAELFVVAWSAIGHNLRWSYFMLTVPGITSLLLTPAMVMRLEALMPETDTDQTPS